MKDSEGRNSSKEKIVSKTNKLIGLTFDDISDAVLDSDSTKTKGRLGEIVEAYFGIENNSSSAPDFIDENIELKVAPLKISYGEYLRPKWRIGLSMVDYHEIAQEESWRDVSRISKKISNLLIIWYLYDDEVSKKEQEIVWATFWEPSEEISEKIQKDFENIKQRVENGVHLSQSEIGNDILTVYPKHHSTFNKEDPSASSEGATVAVDAHPTLDYAEQRGWCITGRGLVYVIADASNVDIENAYGNKYVPKNEMIGEKNPIDLDTGPDSSNYTNK